MAIIPFDSAITNCGDQCIGGQRDIKEMLTDGICNVYDCYMYDTGNGAFQDPWAILHFEAPITIGKITSKWGEEQSLSIFYPVSVKFYTSVDGTTWADRGEGRGSGSEWIWTGNVTGIQYIKIAGTHNPGTSRGGTIGQWTTLCEVVVEDGQTNGSPSELPPYTPPPPAPVVEKPECTSVYGKIYRCGGTMGENRYDRYDCINGKITFIESNSTQCGYQIPITTQDQLISGVSPTENQPAQSGSNTTMILVLLGAAALVGAFFIFKKKGEK